MARPSKHRVSECKFPADRNYAVIKVSSWYLNIDRSLSLQLQYDTTKPSRHTVVTFIGHRTVRGFKPCNFSISQLCKGGIYLLFVTTLPSLPQKEYSCQFIFSRRWTAWLAELCPGLASESQLHDHSQLRPSVESIWTVECKKEKCI